MYIYIYIHIERERYNCTRGGRLNGHSKPLQSATIQ